MKALKDLLDKDNPHFSEHIYGRRTSSSVPAAIESIDKEIGGFLNSEIIVLGSRPGMGSTPLLLSLAINQAKMGKKIVFYSFDLNATRITYQLVAMLSNIPLQNLLSGKVNELLDKEAVERAIARLRSLPIFIEDNILSAEEVKQSLDEHTNKNQVDMVYIDYIQLIKSELNPKTSRNIQITQSMQVLKETAKELNLPIFINSALSRAVETRGGDKRPQLSDLRESGSLEEFADKVFFLYRPEYYGFTEDEEGNSVKDKAYLILEKNRTGYIGEIILSYNPSNMMFTDYQEEDPIDFLTDNLGYKIE